MDISYTSDASAAMAQEATQISGVSMELAAVLFVVGIAGYAFVNSIEIAIIAMSRIRVRHLVERGSHAASSVERLQAQQERFFAFIVVLQNLSVVVAASMGGVLAADVIGGAAGLVLGTILMTLIIAVFGEVTPKILAAHAGDRYPLLVARPVEWLMVLLKPLVISAAAAPNLLSRVLFGGRSGITQTVTEAELRMLIGIGAEEGAVAEADAELLERVFSFGDRRVNEVMVPRTEVRWFPRGTTVRQFYALYLEHPHSRFPVYEGDHDNVVGVVNIKDVLRGIAEGSLVEDNGIDLAMRPALFIPETKFVGAAFAELQRTGHQMAVVVDEYGGTAGVITLEILLEELVGYVSDELRRHEEEIVEVDERTFQVDAGISVHDANEELGIDLPEDEDYETMAGFVLARLGRIPAQGEEFTHDDLRITVTKVEGNRIEEITITRL
ncbi:MAG: hemolysin family protein [Dehalococcoidia bacterium]